MHAERQKIEFLKTMRSICRVKPDEKPMFSQALFRPPLPIVQEKNKSLFRRKKSSERGLWPSNYQQPDVLQDICRLADAAEPADGVLTM